MIDLLPDLPFAPTAPPAAPPLAPPAAPTAATSPGTVATTLPPTTHPAGGLQENSPRTVRAPPKPPLRAKAGVDALPFFKA